jgi:hypothetical protein
MERIYTLPSPLYWHLGEEEQVEKRHGGIGG